MTEINVTATDSEAPPLAAIDALPAHPPMNPVRDRVRRLVRNRGVVLALLFLTLLTFCAVFKNFVMPYNPNQIHVLNRNATPSWAHKLGTDDLGRDILSRMIAGAAIAVRVSLQSVFMALAIALPIGLLSAYIGGKFDAIVMRLVDAGLSFPPLVLALALAGVLGPGVNNASIAISVIVLPGFVRLVRGSALSVKHETFVEASRSMGVPTRRILAKRVLPNIRSPIIVATSLSLGGALLAEAGLSFLGLSVQPPDASWGSMLHAAYVSSLFTNQWQLVIPGAAIALTILAYNTLGDGLRDAVSGSSATGDVKSKSTRRLSGSRRGHPQRGLTSVDVPSTSSNVARNQDDALLSVEHLTVGFEVNGVSLPVVEDLSLTVRRREILGLVGESGSGKTVTSLTIMRLLASPPAIVTSGVVHYEGQDLLQLSLKQMRRVRGASIAMVFQDPMSSLNPAYSIRDQLAEAYRIHTDADRKTAERRALEMLQLVEIPDAASRLRDYPHQLSGGMRQRVMLAMALICGPKLLIADEPTTALDVTVQAQILDLLRSLQRDLDLSVIFVTHDLGVVADLCDRVAVMYAGQIVEQAPVHELFDHPRHPYTAGLLEAMPKASDRLSHLYVIPGSVPTPAAMPTGCRFHPRCAYAMDICRVQPVDLVPLDPATNGEIRLAAKSTTVRCVRCNELALPGTS